MAKDVRPSFGKKLERQQFTIWTKRMSPSRSQRGREERENRSK